MKYIIFITFVLLSFPAYSFEGDLKSTGNLGYENALVELKPLSFKSGVMVFTMTVNTHSANFDDFDLATNTVLYINNIKINPIQTSNLNSHHINGELRFSLEGDITTDIKITIENMASEAIREFYWPKP